MHCVYAMIVITYLQRKGKNLCYPDNWSSLETLAKAVQQKITFPQSRKTKQKEFSFELNLLWLYRLAYAHSLVDPADIKAANKKRKFHLITDLSRETSKVAI